MVDELVTIGSYATLFEANLVKSQLEAFGIEAFLQDAFTVNNNWLWSNGVGGIRVQVPSSRTEEARKILESEPGEGAPQEAAIVCPSCGNSDTHCYLDKRGSFVSWLLLGLPILPATSKRECAACGHRWKADSPVGPDEGRDKAG